MVIVKWMLIAVGSLAVLGAAGLLLSLQLLSRSEANRTPSKLGVTAGQLTPCPESPNCVSTQADPSDTMHYVEPVSYSGSRSRVFEVVRQWLGSQPRVQILHEDSGYLHAVFSSRVFGFRDDVEIYLPDGEGLMHLRSASRVGQGDMGVNRARYQELLQYLDERGLR